MKAKMILNERKYILNGFYEAKVYQVPKSLDKPHGYKYSIVYVENNKRIIGYDNGEHKGDHKHILLDEYKYNFVNIETLFRDFFEDLRRIKK